MLSSKDVDNKTKGKVELKIYNPGQNKKKGATTEFRKYQNNDYKYVEKARDIICNVFDRLLSGEESSQVVRENKKNPLNKTIRENLKDKLYTCDVCEWKIKYLNGLKAHKTKMHSLVKQ